MAELSADPYLPAVAPRRATPLFTALVLATVGLLVAGVVSVAALSGGAANSPQDAVRALMQATAAGDVNAALRAIDPNEAGAIGPGVSAIVADLQKLGVLDAGLNLDGVSGLSATFSGVTMTTASPLDPSRPDLAGVTLTGGTVTTHLDVAQLALGSLVKDALKGRTPSSTTTSPLVSPGRPAPQLVTVERGGQWYVSLGYTIAEAARRKAGAPFPAAGTSIAPAGGASAADAVRQFVTAAVTPDATALIGLLDPTDTAALHDYGSLLLAHAPRTLPTAVTVTSLDLTPSPVAGGTMETVTAFTAHAGATTVSLAPGGCVQVVSPSAPAAGCAPTAGLGTSLGAGLGIVAVQQGGSWYVDPYRTVLDDIDRALAGVDVSRLRTLLSGAGAAGGPLGVLGGPLALFGGMGAAATGVGTACASPSSGTTGVSVCSSSSLIPLAP